MKCVSNSFSQPNTPYLFTGGLGEAVISALTEERRTLEVIRLAVREIPRSGPGPALMDLYGISSRSIVEAVKKLLA